MERTKLLVKNISQYFRDFLETDFHKQRAPKRQIRNQNPDGLLTGIPLSLFWWANASALGLLLSQWKEWLVKIRRGQYITNIPKNVVDLIVEKIRLQEEELTIKALSEAFDGILEYRKLYADEYETYLERSFSIIVEVFEKYFLTEFFALIEKPLERIQANDENTKVLMKIEISQRIASLPWDAVKDLLRRFFLPGDDNEKARADFLALYEHSEILDAIEQFFVTYGVRDLADDLNEIYNNNKTLDKTEVYVYFYDISFQKVTYPLFFVPVSLSSKKGEWTIALESPLYINKNALEWIAQEYDSITEKQGHIKTIGDRIIYLPEVHDPISHFGEILSELCRYFETNETLKPWDGDSEIKKVYSQLVTISNSCYINLFDKSDEAIINDYEELLTLPDDSEIVGMFERLVENFIEKNPESVELVVNADWDTINASEKLVYKSPVPLNEEQRKVLIALSQEQCFHLVIQWPPGTGKSHTITAIVCDYILNGKSVLVVSDKEEALDVVETKISQTLDSVRADENFQNPIFRIGKSGRRFNQIVSGASLSNIKQHHEVIRQKQDEIEKAEVSLEHELQETISEEIGRFKDVSVEEVCGMVELANRLAPIPEFFNPEAILSEENPIESFRTFIESVFVFRRGVAPFRHPVHVSLIEEANKNLPNYRKLLSVWSDIRELAKKLPSEGISAWPGDIPDTLALFEGLVSSVAHDTNEGKDFWKILFGDKTLRDVSILEYLRYLEACFEMEKSSGNIFAYGKDVPDKTIGYFQEPNPESLAIIRAYVQDIQKEKLPIFGFMFSKKKDELDRSLRYTFPSLPPKPHKDVGNIKQTLDYLEFVASKLPEFSVLKKIDNPFRVFTRLRSFPVRPPVGGKHFLIWTRGDLYWIVNRFDMEHVSVASFLDWLRLSGLCASTRERLDTFDTDTAERRVAELDEQVRFCEAVAELRDEIVTISDYISWDRDADIRPVTDNPIFERPGDDFEEYATYLRLYQKYSRTMRLTVSDYHSKRKTLEKMAALKMASVMDSRIIQFSNDHANDVQTLKDIIKAGKKFPKELSAGMRNAFPCIIANIRTYSDFIPLEYRLFDLVIIDEASQVSIAQALPAIFRAKKTIVLGDKMQFSNVKTSQASSETNNKYQKDLDTTFRPLWGNIPSAVERLGCFDIKKSVLDFLGHMQNYQVTLRKHFRSYKELISFSNKYFYDNTLQVMKIRWRRLDEILEFTVLDAETQWRTLRNTNATEADFIMGKLAEMLTSPKKMSAGIITPHTEQQKFLLKMIGDHPSKEAFFQELKLKVMTFDTCQGEERDMIFYSMVATLVDDRLSYIFAKDISIASSEEDKIRLQRLNVGFSRAKEKMHFILSKPAQSFSGGIKDAIMHYWNILHNEKEAGEVDPNSPMEKYILQWIQTCKFYLDNQEKIELVPQFDVGAYLKQLDPTYHHPKYRADFLFSYKDGDTIVNIIIEYDGFHEHFTDLRDVNVGNFDMHYKESDIYRQKVLESYGYIFLRFNRFNLDPNDHPEDTISEKLGEVVASVIENTTRESPSLLDTILRDVASYRNGHKKLCPKCGKLKSIAEFVDASLSTGEGRHCMSCKSTAKAHTEGPNQSALLPTQSSIPRHEIEASITRAISGKSTIAILYGNEWRTIQPTELCNEKYMGHVYRCVKVRLPSGEERHFNVAKIVRVAG